MKILVICGGKSPERDVSLKSGHKVYSTLLKLGYEADKYDWLMSESNDELIKIINKMREYDIIFLALHGDDGENGKVQALLDWHGIKYTGSDSEACLVTMNKFFSNLILKEYGILTPLRYCKSDTSLIKYPCVVKPISTGSSFGVSIVNNEIELQKAITQASAYGEIIIEEYIEGREFSVGVIGDIALPVIEIIPSGVFYDYDNKYKQGNAEEICPAKVSVALETELQHIAVKAHRALGLSVYSRTDFILDENNRIYCLEVNALPGLTDTSLFPQEAKAADIEFDNLCEMIVKLSLKKYDNAY